MASTCQQIIDRAFAKSAAARPNTQTAPQQLIDRVGQCLRECFQVLSRENINLVGVVATVPFNGTGWTRPADCMRVILVQAALGTIASPTIPVGTEIIVVPFDDLLISSGVPCVTELGQAFIPTGQAIDPSGGTITLTYARAPVLPVLASDLIDPFFPTMFDDFLQYDLAAYLAVQDKRTEDEQTFLGMKSGVLGQITDWAKEQTYSLVARFPITAPPLSVVKEGRTEG